MKYRYHDVIDRCSLKHDINMLPASDLTEVLYTTLTHSHCSFHLLVLTYTPHTLRERERERERERLYLALAVLIELRVPQHNTT